MHHHRQTNYKQQFKLYKDEINNLAQRFSTYIDPTRWLYLLSKLEKASILATNIINRDACITKDRKALQQVIKICQASQTLVK